MKSLYLNEWNAIIRYYDIEGDQKPIVYLAALNYPSIGNFLPTATHPRMRGNRGILVDYLGVGCSEHPKDFSHSMEDHARSVAAVLDHEGMTGCVVVGHSMGGTVGICLASQRPELVSQLFVCEGNLTPGGGAMSQRIISYPENEFVDKIFPEMFEDWRVDAHNGNEVLQWLCGGWQGADPRGIYRSSASLVNLAADFKETFFALPIDTTFVYGEETYPGNTGEVTADAPDPDDLKKNGVNIAIVPGAGHRLMLANLEGFVDVLCRAL